MSKILDYLTDKRYDTILSATKARSKKKAARVRLRVPIRECAVRPRQPETLGGQTNIAMRHRSETTALEVPMPLNVEFVM